MRKFPSERWELDYQSCHQRWITYRAPMDWPFGLWAWLCDFGHPGTDPDSGEFSGWDYHGGWIYFYDEKLVTAFLLRWA